MKHDITCYMNNLAKCDMDTLERIISLQYRKFMIFYRCVELYSPAIVDLRYVPGEANTLSIFIVLDSKQDAKQMKKDIKEIMKQKNCEGCVEIKKEELYFSIMMEEED